MIHALVICKILNRRELESNGYLWYKKYIQQVFVVLDHMGN